MTGPAACPACLRPGMSHFLEMASVPVHVGVIWPTREAARNAPHGKIQLGFCAACGMISNSSFDPGLVAYTQPYDNSLHFSPRFQEYARDLATRLIQRYDLRGKDVVEIGCGHGDFLRMLCEGGHNRGLGFDPSYVGRREDGEPSTGAPATDMTATGAPATGVTIIPDIYSAAYASSPADFVCCRQMLEHLERPRHFLSDVRRAIGDRAGTPVFFEVPNALATLRDLLIWDICYEHCSYFSVPSLTGIFEASGFAVGAVYPTYEGQFLCLEASVGAPATDGTNRSERDEQIDELRDEQIDELAQLVARFGESYRHKVEHWKRRLDDLAVRGRRAVVWGAGTKGMMFLNTVGASDAVRAVVDLNPSKQGTFIAGTGQQIVPPDCLREERPDLVIVANPIYQREIREMLGRLGVAADVAAI